ncbi:hypothetical protein N8E89_27175 (plasmid) [Phyllobacterium sp. A18/5-2]|uniref:hypothetical protein n=1 Tax=Phyllobacterium sp. A18/5-2 TaxID=2978392 RepID=UPI0021C76C9B|nr:hypothetical protein [Phyllobacterium sp. A18/5-2]UXN67621.1 hypothetical protein N8E89_27175 [Phyllobacterium sp. A18/5-2]
MKRLRIIIGTAAALILASSNATFAAASNDPSWPCIQRKVPELSVGQVWSGPDIPEAAKSWNADTKINELVAELAPRRTPLDVAQKQIVEYATSLPKEQLNDKLFQLFQGLFETLNREREQVVAGISRYAAKQRDLAADLRKEASAVDAMRAKPDTDPEELDRRDEQLKWETRIFEERVQSLTYVCEVPTIIEQRLYGLSKTIGQSMIKQ